MKSFVRTNLFPFHPSFEESFNFAMKHISLSPHSSARLLPSPAAGRSAGHFKQSSPDTLSEYPPPPHGLHAYTGLLSTTGSYGIQVVSGEAGASLVDSQARVVAEVDAVGVVVAIGEAVYVPDAMHKQARRIWGL